jgi:hypothetical protein
LVHFTSAVVVPSETESVELTTLNKRSVEESTLQSLSSVQETEATAVRSIKAPEPTVYLRFFFIVRYV